MLVVVSVPVLNLKQSFLAAYLQQVVLCGECVDNSNLASLFAQSPDDKPVVLEQWRERESQCCHDQDGCTNAPSTTAVQSQFSTW